MFYAVTTRYGYWLNFSTGRYEQIEKPSLPHLTISSEVAWYWSGIKHGKVVMYELKEVD